MKWKAAADRSPLGWAVRTKNDGGLTFITVYRKQYRTDKNGTKLIDIKKTSQSPDKFEDWESLSENHEWAAALPAVHREQSTPQVVAPETNGQGHGLRWMMGRYSSLLDKLQNTTAALTEATLDNPHIPELIADIRLTSQELLDLL